MNLLEYRHQYYHSGMRGEPTIPAPDILGKADAIDEWTNQKLAESNFINIDSYEQFVDSSCVILAGRIGSGKTTMLNRLKYSIETGTNKYYNDVVMIDTRDFIARLGTIIRLSELAKLTYSEIEYAARQEWEKLINIIVMKKMYDRYKDDDPKDCKKIQAYLEAQELIASRSISAILDRITERLNSIDNFFTKGVALATSAASYAMSVNYDDALDELRTLIQEKGKVLVLIDSIEKYEFNDRIILAILNALVNLCVEYSRKEPQICLKMATPSELIPKLEAINTEKLSNKIVYIRWSYQNLKEFISVRIYRYIKQISYQNIDRHDAVDFFDKYYDELCLTRCDFYFPTFSYCLSHTQKEPRQLLSIYNAWLNFEKLQPNSTRMEFVERAITNDELSRLKGALSIYSSVHPLIYEMFTRTFNGRKYCFSESEFDEWLNVCSNIRQPLDAYDLKKLFVSSGLVGTMVEMHDVEPNHKVMRNKNTVRIKEVLFEYQHKECLSFNATTKFCLHPMVFDILNIEVDKNTFVYPKPVEQDFEYIPWNQR